MNNWRESHCVFEEIAHLKGQGRSCALAVIVRLEGSAYRQPGAKLLVRDDGTLVGNVSGGCLESDVREVGLKIMKGEAPKRLHYDTTGREDVVWGLGVGCGGKVDILVQSCAAAGLGDIVEPVRGLLKGNEPFALSTVVSGPSAGRVVVHTRTGVLAGCTGHAELDRQIAATAADQLRAEKSVFRESGDTGVFTEILVPPPSLVICGAGDDTMPLVRLATDAGFRVTVADHRPAFVTEERFPTAFQRVVARPEEAAPEIPSGPGTFAVVKTHVLVHDRGWVERFVASGARYVGVLGSQSRREEIMRGLTPEQRDAIHGPIGLDLGAEGPDQVAVSIVAELLAVWSGRKPQHLKDRKRPIHG
ncbi:MAG: XdhC family protein [Verrucomicrobiota bacterium]